MNLKSLGGGGIDGYFGVSPDWSTIEVKSGRTIQSILTNGTVQYWRVEDVQKTGGELLASGNYANPVSVAGNSLDNANAIKAILIAQGLSGEYGYFADGLTINNPLDVGIDASYQFWKYVGAETLPYAVTDDTVPSAPDYEKVTFNSASEISNEDGTTAQDTYNIAINSTYTLSSNNEAKLLDLSKFNFLTTGGDVSNNRNLTTFYRRPDLDNASNAGAEPDVIGGTLFIYDLFGSAFVESKTPISRRTRSEGRVSGRNVHIYQWGSDYSGNDWCFVRTPDNYSIYGKPHPIVILNHGNGWVMDGTPQKANFSDKTQFGVDTQNGGTYLDTNRPDYVQYSNPLIEKFLAEGYVVCGAQNDGANYGGGSAGYGNRETTQNIKSFYEHMKANYNVEHQVNFVAASNGSIATLNATRIMTKDSVRSITLLYPLINLHYAWANAYTSQVAEAYRFTSNNNFSNFRSNTAGFDPMITCCEYGILLNSSDENEYANADYYRVGQSDSTKDVQFTRTDTLINSGGGNVGLDIDNVKFYRRCLFDYPRIRCHWSPSDTITPAVAHWTAFRKLLSRGSLTTAFEEQVTGQHGDYTHFEGLDGDGETRIVNWTKL